MGRVSHSCCLLNLASTHDNLLSVQYLRTRYHSRANIEQTMNCVKMLKYLYILIGFSHVDLFLETTHEHPQKIRPVWPAHVRRLPKTCFTIPKDSWEQYSVNSLYIPLGLRPWLPPDVRRFRSTCVTIPKDSWEQEVLKCLYIPIGFRIWTSCSRRLPSTLTK